LDQMLVLGSGLGAVGTHDCMHIARSGPSNLIQRSELLYFKKDKKCIKIW
jgi:hypothetical protein